MPVVRRALDLEHRVARPRARLARAPPAARSCGRRGVVSAYSIRLGERRDDRLLDRLEAVLEEERRDRRLEERREDVAVLRRSARARPSGCRRTGASCAPRPSSRATTAQLAARRRASGSSRAGPPRSPDSARRAPARSRARARCPPGTRAARTTTRGRPPSDVWVKTCSARSGGSASISRASSGSPVAATGASRRSRQPGRQS